MTMQIVHRIFYDHKDAVYRQMVRVCGNAEDAEDVLTEALVIAIEASGQLKDMGISERRWSRSVGAPATG